MTIDHPLPGGELARFLVLLAEADVDFVVCGGIACILHGVSRTTADLALALRLEETNIQRSFRLLNAVDYNHVYLFRSRFFLMRNSARNGLKRRVRWSSRS